MKRKISLLMCVLVAALCLTACGSESTGDTYDKDALAEEADWLIEYCNSVDEDTIIQWNDMSDFAIQLQLTEAGLPFESDAFLDTLDSWQEGIADCGAYVEHGDYEYKVSNGSIEVSTDAKFENRDATIAFLFDENDSAYESMTINVNMSTGEILEKAGLNTVLGMGTAFAVLILIAFIISLIKYIPMIQEKLTKKNKPNADQNAEQAETVSPVATTTTAAAGNEDEIQAVIAAAIQAAMEDEASTDGFVVRSIKRRPSNKWNSK